jgi:RNA polymerase sigma factor (sigma-70 family)
MTTETTDFMAELMADAVWTRRLAGALLGDGSAGDDAMQEAWLRTRGQGPALDDPRGWFRTVVRNVVRTRRRAEGRRGARERASVADGLGVPATAATPEELLGRLQVQRRLAELVAGLAEPGRRVVLLRYYEGLSAAQIALDTGTPPGTVRWRLKQALDELRARLETDHAAEKRDWRLALAPLVPFRERPPVAHATQLALVLALLGAAATVILLPRSHSTERARATDVPVTMQASGPSSPARRRPPLLAAVAVAQPCPAEISAAERDLATARDALAYYLPARNVWSEADSGARNPTAEGALQPAMWRWLDQRGAPPAARSIDCRGDACLVTVVEPWPPAVYWGQHSATAATQAELEARARDVSVDGPRKQSRLLAADQAETRVWFRLHSLSGAPGKTAPPPYPSTLVPSAALRSRASADDGTRTAECRQRLSAAVTDLEGLRRRAVSLVPAPLLFASETPNPPLTARMQALVDRFAAQPGDRQPLTIACRGTVCRVAAVEPAPLRESVTRALGKDPEFAALVRRTSTTSVNGRVPDGSYVVVLPPPSETGSGDDVLRHFLKQLRSDEGAVRCGERFPPSGTLSLRFVLPASGEVNEDGVAERISFRLGGPLADAPYGRCLGLAIAARAAAYSAPPGVSRAEMSKTVELPEP